MELRDFARIIDGYGLTPDGLAPWAAVTIVAVELLAGAGVLFDIRGSLAALTGLTLMFMAVLSYGLWLGLDVDCGCYGPGDPEAEAYHGLWQALFRDAGLLCLAAYMYWRRKYCGVVLRRPWPPFGKQRT